MKLRGLFVLSMCGMLCAQAAAQSTVYAVDLRAAPNRLLTFPSNAPANNAISLNAGFDGFAMDFDATATNLYGITSVAPFQFGTIDQTTGNFTSIASISGAGAAEANWGGISMDPVGNRMLALAGTNLYSIDLGTGSTTLIAPITGVANALWIDIAVDRNGNAFLHDIAGDVMASLNTTTGVATSLGSTGFLANFAQGMDFDWATNTLYAAIYTGGGTGAYCSINTTTGAATSIVSTTSWNAEMEMAIKSPIPAPGSFALLGLGGLLAARRRR